MVRPDRAHHCPDFHPLGGVALVENLLDEPGGEPDLVSIAGVALRCLSRDDFLGEFSGQRLGYRFPDITCPGHAHSLVDVTASGKRIPDRAAQAGCRPAERLDLRRMVVRLVLEHQQPAFDRPVFIHVDEDAAGVVLFADLQVVQFALLSQVPGPDRGYVHEVQALLLAAKFLAQFQIEVERLLDVFLDKGLFDPDLLQFGHEGGMAAVVAPIGVQNPQFGLVRVPAFFPKVVHYFPEIVRIHGQLLCFAIVFQSLVIKASESFQHRSESLARSFSRDSTGLML